MQKIPEIFATGAGHGGVEQAQGSGGGGAVEAVYWVKEVGVQWRVKGRAFVVARDVEGEGEGSSGVRTLKSEVGARMRVLEEGMESEWSWARELTAHFGNCSPGMRGLFRERPPHPPIFTDIYDRLMAQPTPGRPRQRRTGQRPPARAKSNRFGRSSRTREFQSGNYTAG